MVKKLFLFTILSYFLVSCQFTETMVINEDGSGTMTVEVNMNEMMAFGGTEMDNSEVVKMDTIINVRQWMEEKKDSIALLTKEEQMKIKALENYNIHVKIDTETSEMIYDVSLPFKSVREANDIMNSLNNVGNFVPNMNQSGEEAKKEENSPEVIGVNYSFEKGIFKRDAYIKDRLLHQKEVDSLIQAESFLAGTNYSLKYTFPRPIKMASDPKAVISVDRKSLSLKKSFVDYFKDPDILDLEVELEN